MPKIIDYSGRFAFFELAAFTLVRDHGVASLSRHGLARVLATSISTVRRLLSTEADLRRLAVGEVEVRRRRRLRGPRDEDGIDAALTLLGYLVPLRPEHVAEELVWWRLAVAAPSTAAMPADHEHDEGPLHHRFAVATHGYVPEDVLQARVEPAVPAIDAEGCTDVVVRARNERDEDVGDRVLHVVRTVDPTLSAEEAGRIAPVLHAVVDGLGVAVALGRLTPQDALGVVRTHLEGLARTDR